MNRILYLSQRIPFPPNKGDKISTFNHIKYLSKKYRVSSMFLLESKNDYKYIDDLKKYCESVEFVYLDPILRKLKSILCLMNRRPVTLEYFYSKRLKEIITKRISSHEFDLVLMYSSCMAQYLENIKDIPKLMFFAEFDSGKWEYYSKYKSFPLNIFYRWEAKKLLKYEMYIAKTFERSIFVTNYEKKEAEKLLLNIKMDVVHNGVDIDFFTNKKSNKNNRELIFTGHMDYFPNVDAIVYFYQKILPLIQKEIPDVKLIIVGANPKEKISKLSKKNKNIIVTGYVPDIRHFLEKANVMIAPLRMARGIQNKILEAMAMGLPVVTTSLAYRGINAQIDKEIMVADTPNQFAQHVIKLLKDRELRDFIGKNARSFVEREYKWEICLDKLDEIVREFSETKSNPKKELEIY